MSNANRRALVTGASSGIGRAFARELASAGWSLTLVARNEVRLKELARELGTEVQVVAADLSTPEGTRLVAPVCAEQDLVINCAGIMVRGEFAQADIAEVERAMYLMSTSVMALTRASLDGMVARGRGAILNVSSRAAFVPEPGLAVYCASKAAVRSFTLALAKEVEGTEVRVHLTCPGNTHTELHERAGIAASETGSSRREEPEYVARMALAALEKGERVSVPVERLFDRVVARVIRGRFAVKVAGVLTRLARG